MPGKLKKQELQNYVHVCVWESERKIAKTGDVEKQLLVGISYVCQYFLVQILLEGKVKTLMYLSTWNKIVGTLIHSHLVLKAKIYTGVTISF